MIRAALLCVSLASELPGAEERQNFLPFQNPLHPMNRFAHKHVMLTRSKQAQSQADTAEPVPQGEGKCCEVLERPVISTGNHALRGAVNWGAENNRIVTCAALETDKSDPHKTRKTLLYYRYKNSRQLVTLFQFRIKKYELGSSFFLILNSAFLNKFRDIVSHYSISLLLPCPCLSASRRARPAPGEGSADIFPGGTRSASPARRSAGPRLCRNRARS